MKRMVFAIILICTILCAQAYAHSGRTDSNGGHMNHATGEYHYHHGKPAHQHPGGVCPYAMENDEKHDVNTGKKKSSAASVIGVSAIVAGGAYLIFKKR